MDRHLEQHRPLLNRLPGWFKVAVAAPPAIALAVFYLWPFVTLLGRGLRPDVVADQLGDSGTWRVLWFTFWQACASTVATLLLGLAPTWAISRYAFPGRRFLLSLLTAVFVLPTVVVAAAFVALLPDALDRSIWSILGAHVVFNLAVVVRAVSTLWERLPRDLEHAAATLGASPWQVFHRVTLPMLRPALAAAGAIVFLFTFSSFGVVRVLGNASQATIEVEVWRRATQLGDVGGAAVLTMLQLIVLGALVAVSTMVQRRTSRRFDLEPIERVRPTGGRRLAVAAAAGTAAIMVLLPLVALVERSLRFRSGYSLHTWRNLGNNEVRPGIRINVDPVTSIVNSFQNALVATLLAVLIGGLAVIAISVLGRSGRWLDTGLMLPLGTSAVTIGFGMIITFDVDPVDWRASAWLVPVGHALVAAPFVVRTTLGVVRSIDPDQRAAAATLGAAPVRGWATATLPVLWRPMLGAAGLAAAISLGEFGATSFLSRSGTETMPITIDRLLGRTGELFQAQAFALSTMLAAATIAVVFVFDRLAGTRSGVARP